MMRETPADSCHGDPVRFNRGLCHRVGTANRVEQAIDKARKLLAESSLIS
jgi:hypothetical protein